MIAAFDLKNDLPTGRTALEASAGTGKTFSIAGMVTGYVAEAGIEIGAVLVVTFTKAAAAELRDRIRARIEAALHGVESARRGSRPETDDPLLLRLMAGDPEDLDIRFERLEVALADFDTATISTIHSFAQNLLAEQGLAAASNPDATLLEDTSIVLSEAVADVLAARGASGKTFVRPKWVSDGAEAALAREVAVLRPTRAEVEAYTGRAAPVLETLDQMAELAEVVDQVVSRVRSIRRARAVLGFEDLLSVARSLAVDPVEGPQMVRDVQKRYQVALIDEFQDTDAVQWELLSTLFSGIHAFTLVGDPKQSIYRFRGADIDSYRAAVNSCDHQFTLDKNFRSDALMLKGAEALFQGRHFGHPDISFASVQCGMDSLDPLTSQRGPRSGVEVRCADFGAIAAQSKAQIERDIGATVVELLQTTTLPDEDGVPRALRPGDIAVLVKSHNAAPGIQRTLGHCGVPSVVGKVGSVMKTDAALQLLTLLRAIAIPASERRVRAAAIGWFVEETWERIETGYLDDAGIRQSVVTDLQHQFSQWADLLDRQGLPAFFDHVWQHNDLAVRLMRQGDGERRLTDLNHLREILQGSGETQIHRLVERFEVLMAQDEDDEADSDAFARRTESDDDAVQVMTVHASKGLEFPVVLTVGLHARVTASRPSALDRPGGRELLLGAAKHWKDSDFDDEVKDQLLGELRRLIYVAVTRAKHLSILYVAKPEKGALAQILFDGKAPTDTATAVADLSASRTGHDNSFRVVAIDPPFDLPVWNRPNDGSTTRLDVARIERAFDRSPWRWSFTRISGFRVQEGDHTEDGSTAALGQDAPETGVTDEATPDGLTVDDSDVHGSELPLGNVAGGASFGTLVHEVLENIDFASPNLAQELASEVGTAVQWSNWSIDPEELTNGLLAAIETPLGSLLDDRPMRSFEASDVLDEMNFELPLAPEVTPEHRPTGADIGKLAVKHLASDDPLQPWAHDLADGGIRVDLAGHLTGAIDGIFRVRDEGRPDRFVVVDYKTNRLGTYGTSLRLSDYERPAMATAMAHHDYPLQALLYATALHRYLRWRLPDYDPGVHLGGAAYLFVRGMIGPQTPLSDGVPHGVFTWDIPSVLVTELSDLLHSGVTEPGERT